MSTELYYKQKEGKRTLKRSLEFKNMSFALGATWLLVAIFVFSAYDMKMGVFSSTALMAAGVYGVMAVVDSIIWLVMRSQLLKDGKISSGVRIFGILLILTIAAGNIFNAIAGFMLICKEKNLEYQISVYMVLVEVIIVLISLLNIFKPYVTNTYFLGQGMLVAIIIFHLIAMVLVKKYVNGNCAPKKLIPLGILLIASTATGNLLSLLLGLIVLRKVANQDSEISVGWIDVFKRVLRSQTAVLGLLIIVILLSTSVCSYLTFDYDMAVNNNYSAILQVPTLEYPFGTDDYGRCVFTRVVFGARISLFVGVGSSLVSIVVGVLLGAISGYYAGKVDNGIMRVLDIFQAIPGLLLPIAIITAFGASTINIMIALGAGAIPGYARTIRASVMTQSGNEFVEAARACGAGDTAIIFKHILPNSLAPVIVRATVGIGAGVLAVSSLSYLGLGIEPHIPEWGNILKAGSTYLETSPYLAIYPGLAIISLVLSFNFLGDGLRDALDPKLK